MRGKKAKHLRKMAANISNEPTSYTYQKTGSYTIITRLHPVCKRFVYKEMKLVSP